MLSCIAQMSPQSKTITEKFFPELELEINTPAFKKKKGFTNYQELMSFLNNLKAMYPANVAIQYIGSSQKGKQIPLVKIMGTKPDSSRVKVWLQGGLHGNEPASTEGVLFLMQQILSNKKYNYLLNKIELGIVPMANIDGYEKQDRYAANGLDLNRDQTKLMAQESISLKQAFSDFDAEVAIDFHEYKPYRKDFAQLSTYGITSRYDVMFLYSGNLNVPKNLRDYTQNLFVKNATDMMKKNNLTSSDYVSTTKHLGDIHFNQGSQSARSSATSYALTNSVSSLIEVRGVGLGRTSFKRRVYTTFLVGLSYLETAYQNSEELKNEIQKAVLAQQEATVKSKRTVSKQNMRVIDLDTEEEIILEVTVRNSLLLEPELTRARPTAYLILESQTEIINKLKVLGQKLEQLQEDKTVLVEKYTISDYQQAAEKYEGVKRQTVSTVISTEAVIMPKGTYILYLNQPKANLAIEVLEPEADNSFVSFTVIKTEKGAILPFYRFVLKEKI